MSEDPFAPAAFTGSVNLASDALGATVVSTSDDFFAEKENLLKVAPAVFLPDEYTERGKWMDGWESRRRRSPGHDWCIIELGAPGMVVGVDIDTAHFLGNHPPFASVDACHTHGDLNDARWTRILPEVALKRGAQNLFGVGDHGPWTHVRLNIYPDGGVARLRVYGAPVAEMPPGVSVDLAALQSGGRAIACSDMFFGSMHNLLLPGRAANMGGGWETRRRRGDGHDWVVLQLGRAGCLDRLEIDTAHFKGNYPPRCIVRGLAWPEAVGTELLASPDWRPVTEELRLGPDAIHTIDTFVDRGPFTHLKLEIMPCGGVSRLRAHGTPADLTPDDDPLLARLRSADEADLTAMLGRCCGATRWVREMVERRPFESRAQLFGVARSVWWHLDAADWREAFEHHPQIGANIESLRAKFSATANWSEGEQSGVSAASEETLQALADGNARYLETYGFIFIVCATGKSAEEMLSILNQRLANSAQDELRFAAEEQAKITRIRLTKLEATS